MSQKIATRDWVEGGGGGEGTGRRLGHFTKITRYVVDGVDE